MDIFRRTWLHDWDFTASTDVLRIHVYILIKSLISVLGSLLCTYKKSIIKWITVELACFQLVVLLKSGWDRLLPDILFFLKAKKTRKQASQGRGSGWYYSGRGKGWGPPLTAELNWLPGDAWTWISKKIAHTGNSSLTGRVLVFIYFSMQSSDSLSNSIKVRRGTTVKVYT